MATHATAQAFFAKPYFAVVGASTNRTKFGYKIFAWYTYHNLPATPINPGSASIAVDGTDHKTLPNIGALPHPKDTALSIITPPAVSLKVLEEAKALGISAVWLQPGAFDDEVLAFANAPDSGFDAVVAGPGGNGHGGWCVLVDGDRALRANGKL